MSDILATALTEGFSAWSRTRTEEARYNWLAHNSSNGPRRVEAARADEITLPNVELINKTERAEMEDGEHVLVTVQKQHIEKKYVPPVPPTPEEIAAERNHKVRLAKIWGSVVAVGVTVIGIVSVVEKRRGTAVGTTTEIASTTHDNI